MLAVVLVGGYGTRLRPLTYDVPKPMLPVGHRPMIVQLVERLAASGVTDVVLALGFRPEPFASAFDGQRFGDVDIHYAIEPEPLDTGGAIAFAARHIGVDDTFLVANGDIITDLDIARLLDAHRSVGADATIHLTPVDDPSAFGVVETGSDGRVQRFVEKPAPGETQSNLINAGTYVFEPSVLDLVPEGERVSVERIVFPALAADRRLAAVSTDDYWIDAGRPEFYLQANLDLAAGRRTVRCDAIEAGADVHASAHLSNSVVSSGAVIANDATVTDSLVLTGGAIAAGATVRGSIVAGYVGASADVTDSVVGPTYRVPDHAVVIDERLPRVCALTGQNVDVTTGSTVTSALVVGGAGFIGSHLVDRLLADDVSVDVVDDLSHGSLGNLAEARNMAGTLKIHHLDAATAECAALIGMRRPDVVYHLAAVPRCAGTADLSRAFGTTMAVVAAARHHRVPKLVTAVPASAIYGRPASKDVPVKERPLEPRGVRGVVARATVDLFEAARDLDAVEFTALALGTVYGPRQRADGGVVAAFAAAAREGVAATIRGDGRQTRDFVFVDDVVDAMVRAGVKGSGLVINVGTGVPTPVREVWQQVAGAAAPTPNEVPAPIDELQRFAISPVRARIHLGWSPWTDLATGLTQL